jgi:hypothetical protein
MTRGWLAIAGVNAGRRASGRAAERWLVVISARGSSSVDVYRYIFSQLRMATDFKRILMVFGDRRVAMLTG